MKGEQDPSGDAPPATDFQRQLESTKAELAEARVKLVRSEKMASLGMLVAGIAHEINTPIGAVRSMHDTMVRAVAKLRLALEKELPDYESRPKIAAMLSIIEDSNRVVSEGSQRVIDIVRRVRSFARLDPAELTEFRLESGLDDTLTLIHHELKHSIRVHRDFGELPAISGYPGRLNQVFLNLLMNARQAIPDQGEIFIKTWLENGYACLSVRDTGVGIPEANLEKIFNPGFTTKVASVGTGLGLSIVKSIVEEHLGSIQVESEVGVGTIFTVRIPTDLGDRLEELSESSPLLEDSQPTELAEPTASDGKDSKDEK